MEYDAIVVGAGILGTSTAYHIKNLCPSDKILLIDQYGSAGQGNTSKSAADFRNFFYSSTNLLLADTSINFYKYLEEKLGIKLKIKWTGYLWLLNTQMYDDLKPTLTKLSSIGLNYKIYEKEELTETLNISDKIEHEEDSKKMGLVNIDKGVFAPKAGSLDVTALVDFYESEFIRLGGEVKYNTKVEQIIVEPVDPIGVSGEPFIWQIPNTVGVKTVNGKINAKKTILATGCSTPLLLDPIGVNSFIKARKRQIFSVRATTKELKKLLWAEGFNEYKCMPFTILPNPKVYIKPELGEEAFWLSCSDKFPRSFLFHEDPQPEENFYLYGINQIVTKYFHQFLGQYPFTSFAGFYSENPLDWQPVIFDEHNLIVVGGTSGSGILKADAVGRIAASLYVKEEYATLFGDKKFKVADLSLDRRKVEPERLNI